MKDEKAYSWLMQPGIQALIYKHDRDTNEAIEAAIRALKRNISRPYLIKHQAGRTYKKAETGETVNVSTYHCPNCGQELGDSDWDGEPSKDWLEYCDNCGQKIDWQNKK